MGRTYAGNGEFVVLDQWLEPRARFGIAAHRRWMTRSYALTFATVTLRLWLPRLAAIFPFETAYQTVSWLAWVPNLLIVEWAIRRNVTL